MYRELKRDLKHAIIDLEYQRCHDGVEAIENAIEYIEELEEKLKVEDELFQCEVTIHEEIVSERFERYLQSINIKYKMTANPVGNFRNYFIEGQGDSKKKAVESAIKLFKDIEEYFRFRRAYEKSR